MRSPTQGSVRRGRRGSRSQEQYARSFGVCDAFDGVVDAEMGSYRSVGDEQLNVSLTTLPSAIADYRPIAIIEADSGQEAEDDESAKAKPASLWCGRRMRMRSDRGLKVRLSQSRDR